MASSGAIVKSATRQVKPLLSLDKVEARRRVLNLYKAWYRQIPYVGKLEISIAQLLTSYRMGMGVLNNLIRDK